MNWRKTFDRVWVRIEIIDVNSIACGDYFFACHCIWSTVVICSWWCSLSEFSISLIVRCTFEQTDNSNGFFSSLKLSFNTVIILHNYDTVHYLVIASLRHCVGYCEMLIMIDVAYCIFRKVVVFEIVRLWIKLKFLSWPLSTIWMYQVFSLEKANKRRNLDIFPHIPTTNNSTQIVIVFRSRLAALRKKVAVHRHHPARKAAHRRQAGPVVQDVIVAEQWHTNPHSREYYWKI